MTAALLKEFMPYGAPDLQEAARPHMVRALALGSLLASLCFALAWSLSLLFAGPPAPVHVPIPVYDIKDVKIIQPPPALVQRPMLPVAVTPPKAATPVPVEDAVAPKDATVASQSELSSAIGDERIPDRGGPPIAPVVDDRPVNEIDQPPIVDELPVAVREVKPPYPDLPYQAGMEGLVLVNVLVGRDGRVLDARLHPKVNSPMFNQVSLEAAKQWVFTPAMDHGHPVAVWVTIPFRYRLY